MNRDRGCRGRKYDGDNDRRTGCGSRTMDDGWIEGRERTTTTNKQTRKNIYAHLPTQPNINTLPQKNRARSKNQRKWPTQVTISNTHLDRNVRTRVDRKAQSTSKSANTMVLCTAKRKRDRTTAERELESEAGRRGEGGRGEAHVLCVSYAAYVCIYVYGGRGE